MTRTEKPLKHPARELTARSVAALKPEALAYYINDTHLKSTGLAIRVAPSGKKTWSFRYRIGRGQRRITLGNYPAITLVDAREKAKNALKQVENGVDPQQLKEDRREADTVATLAKVYIEKHAKKEKRSWKSDQRMLDNEVLPKWKHLLAKEITRRDVRDLVEKIAERGPVYGNRVRALLHMMFEFAMTREIVENNPVVGTKPPGGKEHARKRLLTNDEIRTFWTATEALPLEMRAFWQLRLRTAQRGGEVESMKWADVDLEQRVWRIPATVAKNGQEHLVPLTAEVIETLTELRKHVDGLLAARISRKDKRPKTPVFVLRGARGARQQREAAATFTLDDFTGHDLRRTAATNMRQAGVSSSDISRVLNHQEGGPDATKVYEIYDGFAEKKAALATWERTLKAIIDKKETTVLTFTRQ